MHTNRKLSVLLVAIAVCVPSLPSLGQQSGKGKSAETATVTLLQMHSAYQQASPAQKTQLLTQFQTLAAQRQQLLSSVIQTNPGDVLRVAIPNNIRANMPAAVQNFVEKDTIAQGTLEVAVEMNGTPDHTTGTKMHYGLTVAQGKLGLHFASNPPQNLLTGSLVRIHGVQVGSDVALASGSTNSTSTSSLQVVSAASAPAASGAVSTLVILVNFQDDPTAQPWTPSAVQNMVFTQTSNWDLENSFQKTWLTGDVAGWVTIPVSSKSCSTGTIKSDALSAAQAAGYILSNYTHFIYLMSSNTGCSAWWGYASIGGGDVWINGEYNIAVHVFAHEMGHNFGLYHAHTVDCGTQATCSSGTYSEYGDSFDLMGASTYSAPHYNAFHKEQLGWLNNGAQPPITTVTSSGTFQISPYEAQDSYPKALKILQSGSSNSYYYLEFRQALGFDSFLSSYSDIMNGTLFHLASPSNANSSDLLDLTPTSPSSFSHPALVVGQSYTDSTSGLTIIPTAVSITGATVQVTMNGPVCAPANPGVNVSPTQSQWVISGSSVNFTVTVKDNDSSSCPSSTFNLGDALLSGWSGSWNTTALSLSPGTSGSATLTVTSPSGTADGFYNVAVSATNALTSSYTAAASATYVISTPVPLSISLSTNSSTYSAGQTATITVTLLSGTSADSGASVAVSITKPNGSLASLSGTTGTNGTAVLSYRLGRKSPLGTYLVQATTSSTGNAAPVAASTTFVVQ
jgi:hypothetical protein